MLTKPERYTVPDVIAAIEATKGMISLAARKLGCHPNTVRNYIERHPTVASAYREQREGSIDIAELKLLEAVQKGEGWAIAFLLRTIGRDRGYVERQEVQHEGTITVKGYTTKDVSPDAWDQNTTEG